MKKRSLAFITAVCVCAVLSCMGQIPVHADDIPGNQSGVGSIINGTYPGVPLVPGTDDTGNYSVIIDGNSTFLGDGNTTWIDDGNTTWIDDGNTTSIDDGNTTSIDDGNTTSPEVGNTTENITPDKPEPAEPVKDETNSNSGNVTDTIPTVTNETPDTAAINISGASVSFTSIKGKMTYTGKKRRPAVQVVLNGKTLVKDTDYTVSYKNNVNAGTAAVVISGKGGYTGSVEKTFTIIKAKNTVKLKTAKKALKYSTLKKKNVSFTVKASVKGKAKKAFEKVRVPKAVKKFITVSSKGKITVKKGIGKGTWKIKVKITTSAVKNYKKTAVKKTIKIIVK